MLSLSGHRPSATLAQHGSQRAARRALPGRSYCTGSAGLGQTAPPKAWKVLFFGSGDVALETVKLLHDRKDLVSHLEVVCPPDKQLPHQMQTTPNETSGVAVKRWARKSAVPALTYQKAALDEVVDACSRNDIGVVVDFGYLLPKRVLDAFKYWPILMHPSLLPKYRGATPIERTLMSGDAESGISVLQLHPNKFDAGRLLLQRSFPIESDAITAKELRPLLATEGAKAVVRCLEDYAAVVAGMKEQTNEGFSPAPKLTKKDFIIQWSDSGRQIYNQWRALASLRTCLVGMVAASSESLREATIFEIKAPSQVANLRPPMTSAQPNAAPPAGSFVFDRKADLLWVKCGAAQDGDWIAVSKLQLAGRKANSNVSDFVNGIQLKRNPSLRFDSAHLLAS